MADTGEIVRRLLDDFNAGDLQGMRRALADDLRAYVTNAEGGVDEVAGADEYLARIEAMDLPSAEFGVEITQLVAISEDRVMVMVEVHAVRGGGPSTTSRLTSSPSRVTGSPSGGWSKHCPPPATPSGRSRGAGPPPGVPWT